MKKLLLVFLFLVSCSPIVADHDAARHIYRTTWCPRVRVEKVYRIIRSDGKLWIIVRLNACGEKVILEQQDNTWKDVTWRLR